MRWLPVLLGCLLAASALAPVATAQEVGSTNVDMSLPTLPRPVAPGTNQTFEVNLRYAWNNGFSTEPTTIRLEVVDEPAWLTSTFEPSVIQVETAGEPQGIGDPDANLTIEVASDAPAYALGLATYRAVAEENPPLQGAEDEMEFEVTAGFSGDIAVSLPEGDSVRAQGGFVTKVPLLIENRGNGPLVLTFHVARQPAEALVETPFEVQVPPGPNGSAVTTELEVLVPWKVSESGDVEIEVQPSHAEQGTPGPVRTATFFLDGKSAVPVPGPGPGLAILALLGAVFAMRRRT